MPDDLRDFLLDGADRVLRIVVPRRLGAAQKRLMDSLGVEVVVGDGISASQARGARSMGHYVTPSRGRVDPDEEKVEPLSAEAMRLIEQERQDAQPMTARCAVDGCDWFHDGTVGECRVKAREHREREHPLLVSQSFTQRRRAEQAEAAAAQRRQRLALAAMDDGVPQEPPPVEDVEAEEEDVAEPEPGRAEEAETPIDAFKERGQWSRKRVEPDEAAAAVRAAIAEIGHMPGVDEWRKSKRSPSVSTLLRVFKTWPAVTAAAQAAPEPESTVGTFEETDGRGVEDGEVRDSVLIDNPPAEEGHGHAEGTESAEVAAEVTDEAVSEDVEEDIEAEDEAPPRVELVPAVEDAMRGGDLDAILVGGDEWIGLLEAEQERLLAEADRLTRRAGGVETVVDGLKILRETEAA